MFDWIRNTPLHWEVKSVFNVSMLQSRKLRLCEIFEIFESCISNLISYILEANTSWKFQDRSWINKLCVFSTSIYSRKIFSPINIKGKPDFFIFFPEILPPFNLIKKICDKLLFLVPICKDCRYHHRYSDIFTGNKNGHKTDMKKIMIANDIVTYWNLILTQRRITCSMSYSSTDSGRPLIHVSDWLIFCFGNLILQQKKRKQ